MGVAPEQKMVGVEMAQATPEQKDKAVHLKDYGQHM